MRHCIVTPEIPPITENGGVATNAFNLAGFLSATAGYEVTVLSTRPAEGAADQARQMLRDSCGASYFALEEVDPDWGTREASPVEHDRSLRVYWWLREQGFEVIHFMQYECAGFASIRAKKLGKSFRDTQLVVIFNSPNRWLEEFGQRLHEGTARSYLIDYMERYCARYADAVLAPTRAMLDWLRRDHWELARETLVVPTFNPAIDLEDRLPLDRQHFVFFGRLETRKGLELFAEALCLLAEDGRWQREALRITFLGKVSRAGGKSSNTYLREQLAGLPEAWSWEILDSYSRQQAMEYLGSHSGSIYVMPSLLDNSPNTLLECLGRGLYALCSDAPGVGELCADDHSRFPPVPDALARRLSEVLEDGLAPARPAISEGDAVAARLEFLRGLERRPGLPSARAGEGEGAAGGDMISVIVPHYNLGKYLPEALEALEKQTSSNYEIIIVDDGSTDPVSLSVISALEGRPPHSSLRILRQANRGVCAARNAGAAVARGNLLAFVDADNIPMPGMLESMHRQLRHAGLDCLTCNLYAFEDGEETPFDHLSLFAAFAGGSLEAGLYMNCLGDSNMMTTRGAFEVVGGFRSSPNEASADRAFLIRLIRAGLEVDCTDDCLLAYRRRPDSMSHSGEVYFRSRAVLDAYCEGQPPWLARVIESSFPVYADHDTGGSNSAEVIRLRDELADLKDRYREERGKRRERHKKAKDRYTTLLEWRSNFLVRLARNLKLVKRDF